MNFLSLSLGKQKEREALAVISKNRGEMRRIRAPEGDESTSYVVASITCIKMRGNLHCMMANHFDIWPKVV